MENLVGCESALHACAQICTAHATSANNAKSLLPCGRRGTACGGGWRTQWLMRVCCLVACAYVAVSYQLARPAGYHPPLARSPLFQRKRAFFIFFSFSFYIIGRFWGMKKPRVWCPRFCGCLVIRRCGLRWCMGIRCRIESLRFDPVPVRGYTCHRRCKCLRGMRCRPRIRGHPVGVLRG